MQIYANQFQKHLMQNGLPAFVLIFGDEPQQKIEAIDSVRVAAKSSGFDEKQTLTADSEFNWSQLIEAMQTMSLFAERQYIELTLPTGKPGSAGAKVLTELANQESDNLLLIQGPKIGKDVQNAKWFKALNEKGVFVHTFPLENKQLLNWITIRARQAGLNISQNGIAIIADCCEGNLISASQEIEKLGLLIENPQEPIKDDDILSSLVNHSRYTVFQLTDELLKGNTNRAVKILLHLETEGIEPNIILWALIREAQLLQTCLDYQKTHDSIPFNKLGIWSNKQSLYKSAMMRFTGIHIQRLLSELEIIDIRFKSQLITKPYIILSHLLILFTHNNAPRLA